MKPITTLALLLAAAILLCSGSADAARLRGPSSRNPGTFRARSLWGEVTAKKNVDDFCTYNGDCKSGHCIRSLCTEGKVGDTCGNNGECYGTSWSHGPGVTYTQGLDYRDRGTTVRGVASKEACYAACLANKQCKVGVFTAWDKTCWIKYSKNEPVKKSGRVACEPYAAASYASTCAHDGCFCNAGRCKARLPEAAGCNDGSQCSSGHCRQFLCSDGTPGSSCDHDSECNSGGCKNNQCNCVNSGLAGFFTNGRCIGKNP